MFRTPNFVLVTKLSIFVRFGSFFVSKLHLSHSWVKSKKKIGQTEPFWTRFYRFSKKYPRSMRFNFFEHRTLFWSTNRQFWFDLVHFLWASSTWARVGDKIKKLGGASHFGHVFTDFQKIIRARWGLTFSKTELCFGHQIVNFRPIWLIFLGKLHLSHIWGWNKKIGQSEPFWTRFYRFSKKRSALDEA